MAEVFTFHLRSPPSSTQSTGHIVMSCGTPVLSWGCGLLPLEPVCTGRGSLWVGPWLHMK